MRKPIREDKAKRMRRCPRCRKQSLRIKVELFLDIDVKWSHRLTKKTLRDSGVQLDGAGWPEATRYCSKGCGWMGDGA